MGVAGDIADDGGTGGSADAAGAGVTGFVDGRNNAPFWPQPASSPAPSNSSDAETT